MSRVPQLNALKYFATSARHLNFRLAAEELSVTQGAVAQQVRNLEDVLGVKLFKRLARGLDLTDEGRAYFVSVQRAIAIIEQATNNIKPRKEILNISTTPSFAAKWLVPRLQDFMENNPDIDVRISASEAVTDFRSDGIDIAIRQGKPPFGAALNAELIAPIELVAVCHVDYFKNQVGPASLGGKVQQTLLQDGHNYWPVYFDQAGVKAETSNFRFLKFNQTSLAIDAAIAGQGIALAPISFVRGDINSNRLCNPFEFSIKTDYGFYAVIPKATQKPDLVGKMKDWLLTQINLLNEK